MYCVDKRAHAGRGSAILWIYSSDGDGIKVCGWICGRPVRQVRPRLLQLPQLPSLQLPPRRHPPPSLHVSYIQGVQEKNCGFFSQFTATPLSPTPLEETFNDLNAMEVYSHSYWLVNFLYNQ